MYVSVKCNGVCHSVVESECHKVNNIIIPCVFFFPPLFLDVYIHTHIYWSHAEDKSKRCRIVMWLWPLEVVCGNFDKKLTEHSQNYIITSWLLVAWFLRQFSQVLLISIFFFFFYCFGSILISKVYTINSYINVDSL